MAENLAMPAGNQRAGRKFATEYAELKWLVTEQGLYVRKSSYYWLKILYTLGLLGIGIAVIFLTDSIWLQILNGFFMAFVTGQIGLIMHDAGHQQIFTKSQHNNLLNLFMSNFLVALCYSWWVDKHNQHHSHPNFDEIDPDINFPFLAYTEGQALEKKGIAKFIVKHQAFLLVPMMSLVSVLLRWEGLQFLFKGKSKQPILESIALIAGSALYFVLVFTQLPLLVAIAFVLIHQVVTGIYLGLIFAPNHKGMPVFDKDAKVDFFRLQVLTSRNVAGHPVTDFVYGGLNYQIEHHLFPSMPRHRLREARDIVIKFCKSKEVPYHETSIARSFVEIFRFMHEVGAPLRKPVDLLAKE